MAFVIIVLIYIAAMLYGYVIDTYVIQPEHLAKYSVFWFALMAPAILLLLGDGVLFYFYLKNLIKTRRFWDE